MCVIYEKVPAHQFLAFALHVCQNKHGMLVLRARVDHKYSVLKNIVDEKKVNFVADVKFVFLISWLMYYTNNEHFPDLRYEFLQFTYPYIVYSYCVHVQCTCMCT